uniref:Uncharacterized protein n=1 Tax=Oryza sativa subsp. japonica TaxID=39947 RepID=Q6EQ20_ORYSJ|nr:hypothetical protein [Oryza sativa Japonica Group]BAD29250.1 hypothetical protein [Oryza sativa Japonica Group]
MRRRRLHGAWRRCGASAACGSSSRPRIAERRLYLCLALERRRRWVGKDGRGEDWYPFEESIPYIPPRYGAGQFVHSIHLTSAAGAAVALCPPGHTPNITSPRTEMKNGKFLTDRHK